MIGAIVNGIEKHFSENWTETKIQFEGTDEALQGEWLRVDVAPYSRPARTISGCLMSAPAMLQVKAYAKNKVRAAELSDMIQPFMETMSDKQFVFEPVEVLTYGITDGGAYFYHLIVETKYQ